MGVVFRQSAKSAIVVITGAVLGALTVFLSTKYLSRQEYGFIGNLTTNALTLALLIVSGVNSTLAFYIHRYSGDEIKRKVLITLSLLIPTLILGIVTCVYFFLKLWILGHFQANDKIFMEQYFIWLPPYTLFFIYIIILEQFLVSQMKVAVSGFMREVVLRCLNMVLIVLFALGQIPFSTLVIGSILIYAVVVTVLYLISSQTRGFGFSLQVKKINIAEYKEMMHYSWYHQLLSISIMLIGCMDVLLLPFYDHDGFSAAAIYRVAVFLISFLQIPLKAMLPASFTVLAKAFNEHDVEKTRDIFKRSSINIFIPTACIAVLLFCNLRNVIAIIPDSYSEIIPVFLILLIGNVANIASGMNDQVLSITNYYKFNFYLSLALITLLFGFMRVLIPIYGIYGAAWSTTLVLMIFNVAKCLFVWKKLNMQPFSLNTIKVILATLPALIAGYCLPYYFSHISNPYLQSFTDATLRSLVIIVMYVLMLLWLKPSTDLEDYLASIKENKRLF